MPIKGPDAQPRFPRLAELKNRLNPANWSQRTAGIVYATCAATAICLGGYLTFNYGKYSLANKLQQVALAGEPPATDPKVDEVLGQTRALVRYLESIEAGPNGIVVSSTACTPLQLPPDPDLLLDPSVAARATSLAMDCPTLGQGRVSERGVKVQSGHTLVSAGWRISSGATPTATAVLAVDTDGFKIATTGVKAGKTDSDASADCRTGLDGAFDCDVNRGGKTSRVKVAADAGRKLLVWLGDLIKGRLKTVENSGVTASPKAAEAPAPGRK